MPLPQIKHCLICEDIRQEQRSLVSLMGVYGATPDVGIAAADLKLAVLFCLVFLGGSGEGKFSIKLQIRCPDGSPVPATIVPQANEQEFSPKSFSAFAFRVSATFPQPDTYTLILTAGDVELFRNTFIIARGNVAQMNES